MSINKESWEFEGKESKETGGKKTEKGGFF